VSEAESTQNTVTSPILVPLAAINMRPFKTIRLIWTFYKSFFFVSMVITTCCLSVFWKYGFSVFSGLFWLKTATLGLTYYFINSYKNKEYYYYQNLGISKVLLWVVTLTFDFALFIFLITQTYKFK
jgi:hypothetical protein